MVDDLRNDVPTVADLCPPNLNYPYFEGPNLPRFDPEATGYSPVNAWWLAEASLLAYGTPELFERVRKSDNLLARDNVSLQTLDDGHENGVLLLSTEDFLIVAFRGTRVLGLEDPLAFQKSVKPHLCDVVTDIQFAQVAFRQGKVHRGFLEAYDRLAKKLDGHLTNRRDRDIWFTGHSLGAALATLAAAQRGNFRALYTFGSPRVGDESFVETFNGMPCYRVVHQDDIVARLPPPRLPGISRDTYCDLGRLVYIDRSGRVDPNRAADSILDLGKWQLDLESFKQGWQDMVSDVAKIFAQKPSIKKLTDVSVLRNAITDHAPIFYARHLKKQLLG